MKTTPRRILRYFCRVESNLIARHDERSRFIFFSKSDSEACNERYEIRGSFSRITRVKTSRGIQGTELSARSKAVKYMFKPSINIERRNVVPIVYSRRLGSDAEKREGYSITTEVRRSVLWPRSRGNSAFYGSHRRKTTACPLGQSTQKPITGFPSVLPQHGKRISLHDIPSWTSLNDSLF